MTEQDVPSDLSNTTSLAARNFDAVPLLVISSKTEIDGNLPIDWHSGLCQATMLRDERAYHPQHYPVDLARDGRQDMDLMTRCARSPRRLRRRNVFAEIIIQQLGQTSDWCPEEIRRSIDFFKEIPETISRHLIGLRTRLSTWQADWPN